MVYRRVLIVGEISPEDQTKLVKRFDEENWGYYDVKSGTDASNLLERDGYDAMIFDIEAPGISPKKILEKAHNKGTPTILIGDKKALKDYEETGGISSTVIKSKNLSKNLEEQIKEIFSKQVGNIHRIGIAGTGKIGAEVANRLVEYEGLATHIFLYNGKNMSRAEALKSSLNVHIEDKKRDIETYVCGDFKDLVENCGIIVCAIGKAEKEKECTQRLEVLQFYVDPIIDLANIAEGKNNSNMIMVTNTPCPLSLVYHMFSKGAKVEASLVVDSKRTKYRMSEWAKQYLGIQDPNVSATVIGPHSENMFIAEAKINGTPLEIVAAGLEKLADDLKRPDYENYHRLSETEKMSFTNLLEKTIEYGNKERLLNEKLILPLTPGQGIIDQIQAIINNGRTTTGIHKLLDRDSNFKDTEYEERLRNFFPNGIFIGWPVEYNDFSAYPLEIRLTDDQKNIFYKKLMAERKSILEEFSKLKTHPELTDFFFTEQKQYRNGNNSK